VANAYLMWLKQILSALATVAKRNFMLAEAQVSHLQINAPVCSKEK
jgi:hypothetical protein